MKDCKQCKGVGWLGRLGDDSSGEGVLFGRVLPDASLKDGRSIHAWFVCPCTVRGEEEIESLMVRQLSRYQLEDVGAEQLAAESGYTKEQVQIRLGWLASYVDCYLNYSDSYFFEVGGLSPLHEIYTLEGVDPSWREDREKTATEIMNVIKRVRSAHLN